jgi:WD40-like Beta Propeller Repeat
VLQNAPRLPRLRSTALAALTVAAAGCAPVASSDTTPNDGAGQAPQLAFCRQSLSTSSTAEIALRTAQNLGTSRVADRSGRELHVRAHPDGDHVVFTRQTTAGNASTGDLYVSSRSGLSAETRITNSTGFDETPCWSPNGAVVLFATARAGDSRLWTCAMDGQNPQPFLAADPGIEDREPDWSRTTDRIVFVRRQGGQSRMHLVFGDGTGLVPFGTQRPSAHSELGLREPCFSPDGSKVAFVEILASGISRLWSIDLVTEVESLLFDPQGEVRMPRYAPLGDRLLCAIAQPLQGRQGLRLSMLDAGGTNPQLVEPGEQWACYGVDAFPTMPQAPVPAATEAVALSAIEVQLSAGVVTQGSKNQLGAADNQFLILASETFEGREIAGINCKASLPVGSVNEIVAIRARIVAKLSRSDAESTLRTSYYNPVAERFDTVAEIDGPGVNSRTLTFTSQSLAHVTLERQVRVTAIGDWSAGARAELAVDEVRIEVVRLPLAVR